MGTREGDKGKREEGQQGKRKHDRVQVTERTERQMGVGGSQKQIREKSQEEGRLEGAGGGKRRDQEERQRRRGKRCKS